jgi:hypothetical protein
MKYHRKHSNNSYQPLFQKGLFRKRDSVKMEFGQQPPKGLLQGPVLPSIPLLPLHIYQVSNLMARMSRQSIKISRLMRLIPCI